MRVAATIVWLVIAAADPSSAGAPSITADQIVVIKSQHKMILMSHGLVLRTYKVALGRGGMDAKQGQGDHRTPEGRYSVDGRNAASRYYMALHLSYPNDADRERSKSAGVSAGGDIEIHGLPKKLSWVGPAHRWVDWTDGCVAVTDTEMDEIWRLVPTGTPVEIRRNP